MALDMDNVISEPVKTTMSVDEFNRTIAYRWLTLPKDAEVRIINNTDPEEVLIEVQGQRMWRVKRKYVLKQPKREPVRQVRVKSTMDDRLRKLAPPAFKLYYWILSIDSRTFMNQSAQNDLGIAAATVRSALQKLEQAKLIKVLAVTPNVGYTVEVIQ